MVSLCCTPCCVSHCLLLAPRGVVLPTPPWASRGCQCVWWLPYVTYIGSYRKNSFIYAFWIYTLITEKVTPYESQGAIPDIPEGELVRAGKLKYFVAGFTCMLDNSLQASLEVTHTKILLSYQWHNHRCSAPFNCGLPESHRNFLTISNHDNILPACSLFCSILLFLAIIFFSFNFCL